MPMAYPPSAARHRTALKVLHFYQIADRCLIVVSTFSKIVVRVAFPVAEVNTRRQQTFRIFLTGFSYSPPGHLLKTPLSCP